MINQSRSVYTDLVALRRAVWHDEESLPAAAAAFAAASSAFCAHIPTLLGAALDCAYTGPIDIAALAEAANATGAVLDGTASIKRAKIGVRRETATTIDDWRQCVNQNTPYQRSYTVWRTILTFGSGASGVRLLEQRAEGGYLLSLEIGYWQVDDYTPICWDGGSVAHRCDRAIDACSTIYFGG